MTDITTINVLIITGEHEDAGTGNGTVYLGICGREFCCNTSADDFKSGAGNNFVFGAGSNVLRAASNDPRKPQLRVEDLALFPAYIRHDQRNSSHWHLFQASVVINGNAFIFDTFETKLGLDGIWLGVNSGEYCYLHRHTHTIPELSNVGATTSIAEDSNLSPK